MAAIQNIESLPKRGFFSELPCIYHQLLSAEELAGSKIIQGIGDYFLKQSFMQVETPMLQVIPSGATARPFVTHHNALDIDMYLRIAPELYLKRVVVGGFEGVFEINRNFRNESLSTRRSPEFTMIEFYQAYADYNDMMDLYSFLLLI